jgi:hypothetical protein
MAKKMLSGYPEYAKSPPDYIVAIADVLSHFDDEIQTFLSDRVRGIPSKCTYLPTIADIVKAANEFENHRAEHRLRSTKVRRIAEPTPSFVAPACPFPQLARAFAHEPHFLKRGFKTLSDACRALVCGGGTEHARSILEAGR